VRRFYYILIILLVGLLPVVGVGETIEDDPDLVVAYSRAKRLMREGKFLEASRAFEMMAGQYSRSPNLDLITFNRAKADYYFGDYDKAQAGFSNFTARYRRSPYYAHARYFLGNINYIKNYVTRALKAYFEAYGASGDDQLTRLTLAAVDGVIVNARTVHLGPADFEKLPENKKCRLINRVVDLLVARQDVVTARSLKAVCGGQLDVPDSVASGLHGELMLAAVLPLSGEMQSFGEEILNGAIIGAELYRSETGNKITIDPFDTKGDPINAARIVRELTNTGHSAVIGPLTSEEAAVAAAVLNCSDLPLIAPAATQAGLTLVSDGAFQLSPNVELQGLHIAEYAASQLGADSAVVLTSTANEDLQIARAFVHRFEQLGGKVVAVEYYRTRDSDFGPYIKDIKAALLGAHPDSVYFINEYGDTLDTDGVPAQVDCIFMPGQARQLKQLLPQVNFYNLSGAYLGSDGWGDETILKLGENITRQAVFPSPFLKKENTEEYLAFARAYDLRYGRQPQRLAALGFDAVRLLSRAAELAGTGRNPIKEYLLQTTDYPGAAGRVTFGVHRENIAMPLYRIESDQAVYLGVGEVTEEN